MFALNQGEVCTCPSRALIQNSIIDSFLPAATDRVKKIVQGNPLDTDTMIGAQASNDQLEKILSYIQIGAEEGARIICGGERVDLGGDLSGGYYVAPTIFQGHNNELLPRLSRARRLRRLQGIRHRRRESCDDARPLPADKEPAGVLLAECPRLLLIGAGSTWSIVST
jgi:hypothetical protein